MQATIRTATTPSDDVCNGIDDDCDPATTDVDRVTRASIDPLGGPHDPIQTYESWPFAVLQLAVDDLGPGEVLVVCPCIYAGFQVWDDPATYPDEWPNGLDGIVIESLTGPGETIVEGAIEIGPNFSGVELALTLRGLTLTGANDSALIVEIDHPVITIEDSVIADNSGLADSAIWWSASVDGAEVDLVRTSFERNCAGERRKRT